MALRTLSASAPSSTAAWWTSDTTVSIHATTDVSLGVITNLGVAFTASGTTRSSQGVWIFPTVLTSGTLTATLRETGVGVASVTVNVADLVPNEWNFLKISPYTYTTVVANSYRWGFLFSVTGNFLAANSGGTSIATNPIRDAATTTLAATDDIWFGKMLTGAGTSTLSDLTIDSNLSWGSGTDTSALTSARSNNGGSALQMGAGANLTVDTSVSRTITCKGSHWFTGTLSIGSAASPVPAANTVTWNIDENGVAGNYGIALSPNLTSVVQGTPKKTTASWFGSMVSGTGITADPVILSKDIGSVGDELCFHATAAIGQTEYRFITAKPTATSYVLSSTSGGPDAALTNAHSTNCEVVNIGRNVVFTTTNVLHGLYLNNFTSSPNTTDWDWVRFENISGVTTANKSTLALDGPAATSANFDYIVMCRALGTSSAYVTVSSVPFTHTGWAIVKGTSTNVGMNFNTATSKTMVDTFVIGNTGAAVNYNGAATVTLQSLRAVDDAGGGVIAAFSSNIFLVNATVQGVGTAAAFATSAAGSNGTFTFTNCKFGSFLANTIGNISQAANKYISVLYDNCLFSDASPNVIGVASAATGTEYSFHAFNQTNNSHYWVTPTALNRSTGSGLSDTYARTVGNLGLRLNPTDTTTGAVWEHLVPARVGKYAASLGFITLNSTFTSDATSSCVVELFLPGSTTADYSQTMSKATNSEQVFNVFANYLGTVDAFALVRITAKAASAGSYAYIADIFNGTNTITGMKTWYKGKPSLVMFEQLGDAAAVWAVAASTLTIPGTAGTTLVDASDPEPLTTPKFLALK